MNHGSARVHCIYWSVSIPRATTSGTRPRARASGSRTSTRCRGCTRSLRATACGRPMSSRTRWLWIRAPPGSSLAAGWWRLRNRCAPSRVGDTAVHGRRRPPSSLRRQSAVDAVRRSAHALTEAIAQAVGRRPVSYRSGRFGFSAAHVAGLERLGYQVESSVAPLFYETHKGGPDFVEAPLTPYFLAYDSATTPGTSALLEVPVSAALNRKLPRRLQSRCTPGLRGPT